MQINLVVTLIVVSIFLILLTTYILKKGRISEKYSLLWYGVSLILLLVAIFPSLFISISKNLGFDVMSSLIIGIFIGILLLLVMALTVMIAGQKKKTTLLIQEVSILKKEILKIKDSKK